MLTEPLYYIVVAAGLLLAYVCGAIPVALIVGRLLRGIDIREHGSGNPGTTNAIRVLGTVPGVVVLLFDAAKGALACLLMYLLLTRVFVGISGSQLDLPKLFALFAAISGHMFSPFMGFKGGKGIATALGGFLAVLPLSALAGVIIFAFVVLITRIVSIGSMLAALSLPFTTWIFYDAPIVSVICISICSLVVLYAHRKNIVRLAHGEEPRLSFKRKGSV